MSLHIDSINEAAQTLMKSSSTSNSSIWLENTVHAATQTQIHIPCQTCISLRIQLTTSRGNPAARSTWMSYHLFPPSFCRPVYIRTAFSSVPDRGRLMQCLKRIIGVDSCSDWPCILSEFVLVSLLSPMDCPSSLRPEIREIFLPAHSFCQRCFSPVR